MKKNEQNEKNALNQQNKQNKENIQNDKQEQNERLDTMINTILEWSNINSGSLNVLGLEQMAEALIDAFKVLDCEYEVLSVLSMKQIDSQGKEENVYVGPLLRFWKRMDAPNRVLLAGHMDTVYPASHPFQRAERSSINTLHGPGVTDMKGGICIMLEALKAFERYEHRNNLGWEVIINPDEEIGSMGSARIFADRAKLHHLALLFEPAMDEQGTLTGERGGSGKFAIVVRGKAAHVGRDYEKGVSAILCVAKIIERIEALNGQREKVILNVGRVEGGGSLNVVPDLAICRIDVRTGKLEDEQWLMDHFQKIINDVQQSGIKIELSGNFTRKPKHIEGKTKALYELIAEVGKSLGQDIKWKRSGGCSDGNNLYHAGLPNVDSLGVCGGGIHSEKEYLKIDSLIPRVELIKAVLKRICDSGFFN